MTALIDQALQWIRNARARRRAIAELRGFSREQLRDLGIDDRRHIVVYVDGAYPPPAVAEDHSAEVIRFADHPRCCPGLHPRCCPKAA